MAARHRKTFWESDDTPPAQPKTPTQAKTCSVSGKRMYANEGEAKATAAHRMGSDEKDSKQLRTYRCLYCGAWHLTSKPK